MSIHCKNHTAVNLCVVGLQYSGVTSQVSARVILLPTGLWQYLQLLWVFAVAGVGVVVSWYHWVGSKQCQKEDEVR